MDKRYPIGNFDYDVNHEIADAEMYMDQIKELPSKVRRSISQLSEEQLQTPYRENGWTPFQVVHHLGDSHLNSLIRFKLAMTENNPTIRPYDENTWTTLGDYDLMSIEEGLNFLEAIHLKWIAILKTIKNDDWNRTFNHPESGINYTLINALAMYAWHGNHHLAHIELVK
ncbi:MAG: YfiT family bacillithiol transferase [Balneola sp.]